MNLFSQRGFEGTSLRDIAIDASVPLSTIDRYFGTKAALFDELRTSIWRQVTSERDALLNAVLAQAVNEAPDLDAVLYAFVYPVVRRGLDGAGGAYTLRLLREYAALRVHSGLTHAPDAFSQVAERWIQAITKARPALPRERAVWALSFTVSSTFSDQIQHGWYDELMPSSYSPSADEVCAMIVRFCRAGIDSLVEAKGERRTLDSEKVAVR